MIQIAHGLVGRSDLPIPEWLFVYAAAAVLVVSFVGLAVLWPEPRLEDEHWRPLPRGVGRVLGEPASVEVACGAVGLFLLGVVVWSGLSGVQTAAANFAPTFVYVIFWLGLVRLSVLFGDVFRAFNPWRAVGKAVSWVAQKAAGGSLPAPLAYPEGLGHWPAAIGIFAVRRARAGGRRRRPARERGDRGARLLGAHLDRDGALRRRRLDRARRGVLGLLQPLLAHLAVRAPRRRGRAAPPAVGAGRAPPAPGNRAAAGRDDRLGLLRRLLGVGRLEQRRRRTSPASSRTSA